MTAALRWVAATVVALVLSAVAGIAVLAAARAPDAAPSQPHQAAAAAAAQLRPAAVPAAAPRGSAAPVAPISDAELAQARIEMERTMCYGHCPEYEVTLSGSGKVLYGGKENVKVKGVRRARIDREKVRQLLVAFDRAKFFDMPAAGRDCACPSYTDLSSAVVTLTWRGRTRRLDHYHGCTCATQALFDLERQIDQAAGTDRWVGDRGGPLASSGPHPPHSY
jgi:Domain of unknown function (DUF6438)